MSNNYDGWELNFFDQAKNFRDYQWSIIKNKVRKKILEVGPGNCVFLPNYRKISNKIYLYEPSKKLRSKLNIKIKKYANGNWPQLLKFSVTYPVPVRIETTLNIIDIKLT